MAGDALSILRMEPILSVAGLVKRYSRTNPLTGARESVAALNGVSFSIAAGRTMALVGRSGSGKSTLAMCLAVLERPTAGQVLFSGRDLAAASEAELRTLRPRVQLVFQDPAASLNPSFSAEEIVGEPFCVQNKYSSSERSERVQHLLERVGLPAAMAGRRSFEFSGGQRQRLAIARALALEPRVLILDEALSALDCSIQAQLANQLVQLQSAIGLTYLFITHDLAMAAYLADEIAILEGGRIVEQGSPEKILRHPEHPAAHALVAAAFQGRSTANLAGDA